MPKKPSRRSSSIGRKYKKGAKDKKFAAARDAAAARAAVVVQGLGDRNGQRAVISRQGREDARGGARVKGEHAEGPWTHEGALGAEKKLFDDAAAAVAKKAKTE